MSDKKSVPPKKPSMFKCVVSADLFRRAWAAVSTEETRYYLNGVFIQAADDGGAVLVATNDHIMLAFRDADGFVSGGTGIVRLEPKMLQGCLPKKESGADLALIVTDNNAFLIPRELKKGHPSLLRAPFTNPESLVCAQNGGALIDGTFPDWRQVIRPVSKMPRRLGALNCKLLAALNAALTTKDTTPIRVMSTDANETGIHLVFSQAFPDAVGVMMPMRAEIRSALPSWAAPEKATAKAAIKLNRAA